MEGIILKDISREMSQILRHTAERIPLFMDAEGYVRVDELLAVLREKYPALMLGDIVRVVQQNDRHKQRFTLQDEWIRANYGHTLGVLIEHPAVVPPALLYYGTSENALEHIRVNGLLPMQRQYVHLTNEKVLAHQIGRRHGRPVVLEIDAQYAHAAGVIFLRPNPTFWLSKNLPAQFIVF